MCYIFSQHSVTITVDVHGEDNFRSGYFKMSNEDKVLAPVVYHRPALFLVSKQVHADAE